MKVETLKKRERETENVIEFQAGVDVLVIKLRLQNFMEEKQTRVMAVEKKIKTAV